jgi:hypothetical protein
VAAVLRLITADQRATNEAQDDEEDEILEMFSMHKVKSNIQRNDN